MNITINRPSTAQTPKTVGWYRPRLQQLPTPTLELFLQYVGMESEDAIREHVSNVRDKAWEIHSYPCIGLFRFLNFSINLSPVYPQVLDRVREGQTLLDLGCCFGQDLRKIAFDAGVLASNLIGADIESSFIQLGYDLFQDKDTFQAQFVTGSILDGLLVERRGSIDMIHMGSFLHLFSFEEQQRIVARLTELLVPRVGSLVFGRTIGALEGGEFFMKSLGWNMFRHSQQTMRELWGSEWEVHCQLDDYKAAGLNEEMGEWQDAATKQMTFWIVSTGFKVESRY